MTYHLNVQPDADDDLLKATDWIAEYSPEKAAEWYFNAVKAIESLTHFPARCAFAPERKTFGVEIRHLLFDKHRILFVVEDDTVYVLRIRHQAQQPLQPDED